MSNRTRYGVMIDGRRGGYGVVFPDLPVAHGTHLDEALRHAMEAAGEWAQAIPAPRPRLLEALRDDSCVKAVLADGDGGSRSSRSSAANLVGANISHHSRHAGSDRRGSGRTCMRC
jgi:hypothetical protein